MLVDLYTDTPRLSVRPLSEELIDPVVHYKRRNREHLARWEPTRSEDFFTRAYWQKRALTFAHDAQTDRHYQFFLVARTPLGALYPGDIAGSIGVSNVIRGPLQSANLGFAIDASLEGQGLAFEGVTAVMSLAFGVIDLHRLEAGHLLENTRSAALLARLGFERIGLARNYLLINGAWRDHVIYQRLTNPSNP